MVKKYINYLEKFIFYILIFSIPFQTRKIFYFWGESFNEWMSVSLYWTDILILALFVFLISRNIKYYTTKKCGIPETPHIDRRRGCEFLFVFLFAFIIWSGIGVLFANNIYLGLYNWARLIEMAFLFIYVRDFIKNRGERGLISMLWVLVLSAFFQSALAFAQFFSQSSMGLGIFNESPIGILMDGVAKINFANYQMIRAYGTLPHPNVLAVFLGLAVFSCYFLYLNYHKIGNLKKYFLWFVLSFIFMGLFFTFSRSAIIATISLSILFFIFLYFITKDFYQKKRVRELFLVVILYITILVLLFQPLLSERFNVSPDEQAVNLRVFYSRVSFDFIAQSPFFGVGIGGFVTQLENSHYWQNLATWAFQPAHNLYLLIASEIGIIGLILFLCFIGLTLCGRSDLPHKVSDVSRAIFTVFVFSFMFYILGLGLFDHYFWTLQQGRLMMWIFFGIAAAVVVGGE